jgi:hypothetical protein
MAQCCVLASEGRQRYSIYTEKYVKIQRGKKKDFLRIALPEIQKISFYSSSPVTK